MTEENKNLNQDGEQKQPNPEPKEPEKTVEPPKEDAQAPKAEDGKPDYEVKFKESSKEALRIREEKMAIEAALREKEAEIERLKAGGVPQDQGSSYGNNSELFPGFDQLDEEAKRNLIEFTNGVKRTTLEEINKNPAIAFAQKSYNESRWNKAFDSVSTKYPELKESSDDFRQKYFRADNVPENIDNLLEDVAKVYLFDKAQDIGARRAKEQADRIEVERAGGGDKQPVQSRTLEDWNKLAQSNPREFAKLSSQFNEDMKSGKLK